MYSAEWRLCCLDLDVLKATHETFENVRDKMSAKIESVYNTIVPWLVILS